MSRLLDANEKEWVLDDIAEARQLNQTLKKLNMTRREFLKMLKLDPEFANEFIQTEVDATPFFVNDILNAHKICENHKMAAVFSANRMKILSANMPEKYGNKIDLSVSGVLSIRTNLDQANNRIGQLIRDVTPQALLSNPEAE